MTERNTILMDLDTGKWLEVHNIIDGANSVGMTAAQGVICASSLMPGTTPEEVAEWYGAHLEADKPAGPFPEGSKVRNLENGDIGRVLQRVSTPEGELHTLSVRWHIPSLLNPVSYVSPREIEAVEE